MDPIDRKNIIESFCERYKFVPPTVVKYIIVIHGDSKISHQLCEFLNNQDALEQIKDLPLDVMYRKIVDKVNKKLDDIYDYNLAIRFVSDYKFPISVFSQTEFFYELHLYESTFGSYTKYIRLVNKIKELYGFSISKPFTVCATEFLDEYYNIREKIIKTVPTTEAFNTFNNTSIYKLTEGLRKPQFKPNQLMKSIYNQENIGEHNYISIDIKNANFQILNYFKAIKGPTYRDFIAQFCVGFLLDYITESKYSRQVIFGKLNPTKTIKIENIIVGDLIVRLSEETDKAILDNVLYWGADEIIIRDDSKLWFDKISEWCSDVNNTRVHVRVEQYSLTGYEYYVEKPDSSLHKIGEFYMRSCDALGHFKGVNLNYRKIIHTQIVNNRPYTGRDCIYMNDKCRVKILDKIIIKKIWK